MRNYLRSPLIFVLVALFVIPLLIAIQPPTPQLTPPTTPQPTLPIGTPPPPPPSDYEFTPNDSLPPRGEEENTITTAGPETRGTTIEIGGVPLQLPEDVWIRGLVEFSLCAPGYDCSGGPYYVLRRGQ